MMCEDMAPHVQVITCRLAGLGGAEFRRFCHFGGGVLEGVQRVVSASVRCLG